jgi:hypothetical protein
MLVPTQSSLCTQAIASTGMPGPVSRAASPVGLPPLLLPLPPLLPLLPPLPPPLLPVFESSFPASGEKPLVVVDELPPAQP